MDGWVANELRQVDLGDGRLNQRLMRIVGDLIAHPTASVPEACGSWAATKATYRFWASPRVRPETILDPHILATRDRLAAHDTVLVIQDTTDLDFTHHPATTGLGHLAQARLQGIRLHSALAITPAGVPLGLLDQRSWTRDPATLGKRHTRQLRTITEKESGRWLESWQHIQARLPRHTRCVMLADSEADIYDLFAMPRRAGSEWLIRGTHNRRVDTQARYLWQTLEAQPPQGQWTVLLPRADDRPAREATLTARWQTVTVQVPTHHPAPQGCEPVTFQALLVREEQPPEGSAAIVWLLLTTLPIADLAAAQQIVGWYTLRWLIERYHYVLKSGCRVEALQLETAERLQKAVATYALVAWRLLWLTYQARQTPEQVCSVALEEHVWQALYATIHHTTVVPSSPPTLAQAVRWIAQLGGFLGRKGDGEPGVKTIWRGLRRLEDIAATLQLMRGGQPPPRSRDMGNA